MEIDWLMLLTNGMALLPPIKGGVRIKIKALD